MSQRQYFIDNPTDVEDVVEALAHGAVVAQAFANFYALTTRADRSSVRRINLLKGRPADQVGSVVTTMNHIDNLFDWRTLPDGLTQATVRELIDALYHCGPLGFRGPAAAHVPDHMTSPDDGVRTVQLIAPGYRCPSNRFFERALQRSGQSFLYVTSANRSRRQTGADEEPAHYLADALIAEFGEEPDFRIIRHRNEAAARAAYPLYKPMSTTIVAFHKLAPAERGGAPTLLVERHGSLSFLTLAAMVARFGFRLALAPKAATRLPLRVYPSDANIEAVT